MLELIEGFGDQVIAVRAGGKVSADEYRNVLAPAVARAMASGKPVSMLLELGDDFEVYDLGAMFTDAGVGANNLKSFDKFAFVTDNDMFQSAVNMFAPYMPGAVHVFGVAEMESARAWISG